MNFRNYTYDISTLHTTLPHTLIREKLNLLNKLLILRNTLFTSERPERYHLWSFARLSIIFYAGM